MYQVVIIGHGNYPQGVLSAIQLLVGTKEKIKIFNLDSNTTHEIFSKKIKQYIDENEHLIIFADMTGGAPYQIVAEYVLETKKSNCYIVSGCSLNLILDLYVKILEGQINDQNVQKTLENKIIESQKMTRLLPHKSEVKQSKRDLPKEGI